MKLSNLTTGPYKALKAGNFFYYSEERQPAILMIKAHVLQDGPSDEQDTFAIPLSGEKAFLGRYIQGSAQVAKVVNCDFDIDTTHITTDVTVQNNLGEISSMGGDNLLFVNVSGEKGWVNLSTGRLLAAHLLAAHPHEIYVSYSKWSVVVPESECLNNENQILTRYSLAQD